LEYQRGNVEGALRVFDGIDLHAAIQRLQHSFSEKSPAKKGRTRTESPSSVSQHAASLVFEAIYLKAKSQQKLGKFAGNIFFFFLKRLLVVLYTVLFLTVEIVLHLLFTFLILLSLLK
jgi:hypothetical protein